VAQISIRKTLSQIGHARGYVSADMTKGNDSFTHKGSASGEWPRCSPSPVKEWMDSRCYHMHILGWNACAEMAHQHGS
jgi:hypothetical protein